MSRSVNRSTKDGRSARWDEHREERRAELVLAAVAAIDTLGPTAGISDIAREAGVSKPVLYRYFDGLDDLYAAVGRWGADEVMRRLLPAILTDASIRERVAAGVDTYLATIEEHPPVFLLLVRHRAVGIDPLADGKAAIAAAFARVLGDTMRELGVETGGAEPWAQALVGMGLSTGEWWLERQTMSRAAVGAYLTSFIWHAFSGTAVELGVPLPSLEVPHAVPGSITDLEGRRR